MIIGIANRTNKYLLSFATHDGIFHCDEVVGIAILNIAHATVESFVVRTRDKEVLSQVDFVIDIGGGEYDHHMKGFNTRRTTGEKYASAGLVWKDFAEKAIRNVIGDAKVTDMMIQEIKEQLDREIIIPVDQEDNGEKMENHVFSFITKFLPAWYEDVPDYDKAFMRAEITAVNVLQECIKAKYAQLLAIEVLEASYDKVNNGILEIKSQTMPWVDEVIKHNEKHHNAIKFVIFPYPAGGWAAQCVPPSANNKFGQIVPFPNEWAGGNEKTLPEISGIEDAVFCHNGRFFARANSKESVIRMCEIAIKTEV